MSGDAAPTSRTGLRLTAGCVLLVGLAFIQSPGYLVSDTKFDLAVDPWGFLQRATHLWDGAGAFGQLQNQAYGYLWPMGPFFGIGDLVDLPGWVVQRLWLAVVLCVAFVGTALLCRALGVRSDAAMILAGLAYATSPRLLSTLGPISIEAWPSAVAPWVLLPLVVGSERGSPRRMAMLAGLAVAMVGGVNAAATFAVLPLGVVWLLTRSRGPRRRSLMLWWPVFTALGTLWWLLPLFLLGQYSPPFLDFIESASITTFPTTPFDALRGTSAWVPYVEPAWQGGFLTVSEGYLALNSGVVLMLGTVGIALRGHPHRVFLALSLLVGLVLVGTGHLGSVQGWFAAPLNDLLDGSLAPFRNVHKLDPLIRLPLVVGLAWLLELAARTAEPRRLVVAGRDVTVSARPAVVGLAALAVVAAATPAVAGRLAPTDPVQETPPYWRAASAWLEANAGDREVLLAPGSSFADYLWGAPRDEPLQYLEGGPDWAVRNAIPLTPPGNIRMLDAVEERLAQGRGSRGLAAYLARSGIRYVVVRNDLVVSSDIPDPALVHQALADSPGLVPVRGFGPEVGGEAHLETEEGRIVVNGGWQTARRAVEVYQVERTTASAVSASSLPLVVGGPEDLLGLADVGLLGDDPVRLGVDVDPAGDRPDGQVLLTDGLLGRERFFGRVHDGYSAVTTPGDVRRSGNPVPDYQLEEGSRWLTTARLVGAEAVSASASQSDSTMGGGARPGRLPFAALDGDESTEWVARQTGDGPAWWQLDLARPTSVSEVEIILGAAGAERNPVRVRTEAGEVETTLRSGATSTVQLPPGPTGWLRVESASPGGPGLALAEIRIPGTTVRRQLVLPPLAPSWGTPDQILLRALRDERTGCVEVEGRTPCVENRARFSEEPGGFERVVTVAGRRQYRPRVTAAPVAGPGLFDLIQEDQPLNAVGSTVGVPDARASGLAAVDGDTGTAWTPEVDDPRPQLQLNWLGTRSLRGIQVLVDPDSPVRRPTRLDLIWPGGERTVELDEDGAARFRPLRTDRLTVRVLSSANAVSFDAAGNAQGLPVGIGEIRLDGLPYAPLSLSPDRRTRPCGTGPEIEVNGATVRTRLTASPAELFSMEDVEVSVCRGEGEVSLRSGSNLVRVRGTDAVAPRSVHLGTEATPRTVRSAGLGSPTPVRKVAEPPAEGAPWLVLRQNVNPGWEATEGGEQLDPVVVDGWQQGWETDGSGAPVTARFTPDATYRVGLGVGAGLALLLVALLAVPRRRWPGAGLPRLGAARLPLLAAMPAAVAAGALLGGWAGVACAGVGLLLAWTARHLLGDSAAWSVGVLPLLASTGYLFRPWGSDSGWAGEWAWPHYLVLVALAGVVALSVEPNSRRLRDMKGFSTRL
ncbi:alpha-(1-_3)-arabinofuranosyltransferase domain-containing protein [Nocardioides donggukensis]|uniref:DUF3367 domain-containing protein n=1 Tax=Nocardioides donggukensis TaxID=2774019 RepID=A0A927PZ75_9ACTN|nr:alpha-(1->3)-arabinofuranosyltransferase family protein [Nocardioides donggukensis]MBD8869683.1 DUF3367 domain-containing protein [Nocardioides donggukensis]